MTTLPTSKVWLVTGASSGLGLATAISASKVGHIVIACTRDPKQAAHQFPEIEQSGGRWARLDVSDQGTTNVVKQLVEEAGRIDVIVNCAGCLGPLGVMEDINEEAFHQVMSTNFYGPMRVVRGVLPTMRSNRSGTIVQISSTSGIVSSPVNNPYCSSKFALEGFSESLAHEVNPFGIRVILVEPGMFRTGIMHKGQCVAGLPDYQEPAVKEALGWVEQVKAKLDDPAAKVGDPSRFGERVIDIVDGRGLGKGLEGCLRLPLGSDAWEMCKQRGEDLVARSATTKAIAHSTDSETLS